MNWHVIKTLVIKDMTLFFRNQFFAVVSGLGVVMYIIIYFLMPKTVDEDINIAMYAPEIPEAFIEVFDDMIEREVSADPDLYGGGRAAETIVKNFVD